MEMSSKPQFAPAVALIVAYLGVPECIAQEPYFGSQSPQGPYFSSQSPHGTCFNRQSPQALHPPTEHRPIYNTHHVDAQSETWKRHSISGRPPAGDLIKRPEEKPIDKPRSNQSRIVKPHRRCFTASISPETISAITEPAIQRLEPAQYSLRSVITKEGSGSELISSGTLSDTAPPLLPQSHDKGNPTHDNPSTRIPSSQPLSSAAFPRARSTAPTAVQQPNSNQPGNGMAHTRRTSSSAVQKTKRCSSKSSNSKPTVQQSLISPCIKPLINAGSSISDGTTSLLASKSNYQNILDGTHVPGVSYPTELSTKLMSKRVSHNLAEQGRRKRINSALLGIAKLLPNGLKEDSGGEKSSTKDIDAGKRGACGGCGKNRAEQRSTCMANTIELAIEYIKQLQQEVEVANKQTEKLEKNLS